MCFSFKDSFLPLTLAKISEFFVLHVHRSLLLKGHVGKLVEFLLASGPIAVYALALVRHFLLDIVKKPHSSLLEFCRNRFDGGFPF